MDALGICLGASTIGLVRLTRSTAGPEILWSRTQAHEGNARRALLAMLAEIPDLARLRIAATGRKFRHYVALATISEPEAVELATAFLLPAGHPYRTVVSAGGETFMVYQLDESGRVQAIHTGNKCASGTGEFLLQQLGRMNITLAEVAAMAIPEEVHKVSGRCSVFCKSDCTHALNKGVPKPQVVAGLTRMLAGKILELLRKAPHQSVLLAGGCSRNQTLLHYLRQEIPDLLVPAEAPVFEALGAGLWALANEAPAFPGLDGVLVERGTSFSFLRPLAEFQEQVSFQSHPWAEAAAGDETVLGLDVGSTTTKGVILRRADKAILAADYLRTNGDPVGASRQVYASLARQLAAPVRIVGLGVTGSGRQIAGLHAMTGGVINEIIAHATAAVHFDPEVDTIFEIGGQDAKYTYITNGVPSDYAMNEACSAGTGSFLEEAAKESLGIPVADIGPRALAGARPPNFNDQCAAFIGSDIKGAVQEGIATDDILAGLVYSICMNYTNRVKGNRPVGNKVFMQGGVCYNPAIPVAMAALTGKRMVVPPDPGLMGAFGVALVVSHRLDQGLLAPGTFDLARLAAREVSHKKSFRCTGGKERCDRGCEIARIAIEGRIYPFGGICNRYDNLIHRRKVDTAGLDLVQARQRRVFRDLAPASPEDRRPAVGMNRSFLVNTYFPLWNAFFAGLGYRLLLPERPVAAGIDRKGAPFCYPVELAHGQMADLVARQPDILFLPHVKGLPREEGGSSCTCVFVQAEGSYLAAAFPELAGIRTLSGCFDFAAGIEASREAFFGVARELGADRRGAEAALAAGIAAQEALRQDLKRLGAEALAALEGSPDATAVVLFGRPYNAFAPEANKGIPAKLASRGVRIIPFDCLPFETEALAPEMNMYWALGRMLLQTAQLVRRHPQLFATYITNFSCGPDSFLLSYFRDVQGDKPSLTLELDSHTADAGLETRIEAFLDIVASYRQLTRERPASAGRRAFAPSRVDYRDGQAGVTDAAGRWLPLRDERIKVLVPAMGRYGTPLLTRAFARVGVRSEALPPADDEILKLGRGNSSCKECLPLQTTVGSMLHYLTNGRPEDEVTAYFMPSAEGPCRFGQYHVFSQRVIARQRIPNAAVLALNSLNGYGGLGDRFTLAAWRGVIIGDLFDEMWSTVLAGAADRQQGLTVLEAEFARVLAVIDQDWRAIAGQLKASARALAAIPLSRPYAEIPKVSLIGEIYVRHDPIALQRLVERLADRGIIVRTAPNSEWIKYVDWLVKTGVEGERDLGFWLRHYVKRFFDHRIRRLLAPAGLFFDESVQPQDLVRLGEAFIPRQLTGEAILTVGSAFHEILHPACGIISIGPFGCMPTRVAESILSEQFTTSRTRQLLAACGHRPHGARAVVLAQERKLPFLAIETDGNAFPQLIEARLEAFSLQAKRLNDQLLAAS
ncbi:MAG: acyl-CoA dehydratase activase [Thermodesulfobacteriota bacterium]